TRFSAYNYNSSQEAIYAMKLYLVKLETPETPPVPEDKVYYEKLTELPEDGRKVVIYHTASKMVLTSEASSSKLKGTEGTVSENGLEITDEMEILTVHVENGLFLFEGEDGKYLTSGATGNSLSFAEDATAGVAKWNLTSAAEGQWFIKNSTAVYNNNVQALEYYNSLFTTYKEGTGDAYKFEFYGEKQQAEGLVTDLDQITDGSHVVIYNESAGKAMGTELKNNYYRTPVDVTISDDKVVNPAKEVIWTVGVTTDSNGNKIYTFTTQDGHKLSINASNMSLPNDEANDTWTIEASSLENSWRIKNIGRNLYVEYHSSQTRFSAYNYNSSQEAIYAMKLYLVKYDEQSTEPTVIENGKKYVIFNATEEGGNVLGLPDEMGASLKAVPA
ncbi:MAG: hypothetical protein IJM15_00490, partial [Erysipelotrichaceae bacterium]|nr:hypothetical protein [Erysipelotrichaceae bacterium]